ncbi:MAG: tRNA pseudouridine(38-40) synthase TruA [Candidatus Eremiobacteraeota bacterium]|nr:tRNA pseudouridine(38-40) synthase TruA [Candidatus Eremiobacteraeota bacterium]MBC5827239.1 tRNA pseudouridine(38-40) synthase TruA [Candidatus Eremiobacteraeota bacterium]
MRTLALVVEYDGTHFAGFQRQGHARTVAQELEEAFAVMFHHDVALTCAGRTDAGVHATGQVVSFATPSAMPLRRIPIAASALLRSARIAVLKAVERQPGFSARRDALARTYRYRILNRRSPSPLWERRAFHVRADLDDDAMRAAARLLVGEKDFRAFCAGVPPGGRTLRNVRALTVARHCDFIDIQITSDSFLHHMVRIAVGTLVDVGRGKLAPGDVGDILASRDRARAGFTAPPHGLYLTDVRYADPL